VGSRGRDLHSTAGASTSSACFAVSQTPPILAFVTPPKYHWSRPQVALKVLLTSTETEMQAACHGPQRGTGAASSQDPGSRLRR